MPYLLRNSILMILLFCRTLLSCLEAEISVNRILVLIGLKPFQRHTWIESDRCWFSHSVLSIFCKFCLAANLKAPIISNLRKTTWVSHFLWRTAATEIKGPPRVSEGPPLNLQKLIFPPGPIFCLGSWQFVSRHLEFSLTGQWQFRITVGLSQKIIIDQ